MIFREIYNEGFLMIFREIYNGEIYNGPLDAMVA